MEKTKILTERLIIRNYKEKDFNDLYEYLSDEEVLCLAYFPVKSKSH